MTVNEVLDALRMDFAILAEKSDELAKLSSQHSVVTSEMAKITEKIKEHMILLKSVINL